MHTLNIPMDFFLFYWERSWGKRGGNEARMKNQQMLSGHLSLNDG